jgi:hypothetical protein
MKSWTILGSAVTTPTKLVITGFVVHLCARSQPVL